MLDRVAIKQRAKSQIFEGYGNKVLLSLAFIVAGAIAGAFGDSPHSPNNLFYILIQIFFWNPCLVGVHWGYLNAWRGLDIMVFEDIKRGFKPYMRNVGAMFLIAIYTFLWSLLFIIPGIIKWLSYSMTPYLLAEHKNISASEAIGISSKITNGYKGDLFMAWLSFFGWGILSALTFGLLAVFYVIPYIMMTFGGFYDELKAKALENGTISLEDLGEGDYIPPFEYNNKQDESQL